jgi:hypothetical protein
MSFALHVKEEVIAHDFNDEQQKAFLSGFIKQNGDLVYSHQSQKLKISTISNRIVRSLISFLKKIFVGETEVSIIQSQTLKKHKIFQVTLIGDLQKLFFDLNLQKQQEESSFHLPNKWLEESNLRAYISGIFIASGSVNSPKTSNYHLELQFKTSAEAHYFQEVLNDYQFEFKFLKRDSSHYLIYLKKALLVSDFLKFIDAPQSVMEFENERISRDMVNSINRISNIDISNQSKVLKTGHKQVIQIKYLQRKNKLNRLSPKAQVLAKIRLKNPELSFLELEEEMAKNNIQITKSGISYLFKIIEKIYREEHKIEEKKNGK